MSLINKLFKKTSTSIKPAQRSGEIMEHKKEENKITTETKKSNVVLKSDILLSSLTTEKAMSGKNMGRYIFKVAPRANKIEISKAVGKMYNVKAVSVNIINVPRKARQVGKTKGFKSGYKKAVVTLAKGQSIEVK